MSTKLTYTGAEVQELLDKIEKGDFDNAKTLEGHPASYFAIASEVTSLAESFATEQGRINTLYSYFNNGSANDALSLGGKLPSYYATATQYEILQQTLANFKSLFDSMFEKDIDGNIHAKLSLWSSGGITAGEVGSGGSGGGGISYNRLDSWADYSVDKAGYVLSALLGKDLDNRVSALANAGYITQSALAPYALRSEIPSLVGYATQSWVGENYLSKNGGTVNGSITANTFIGNLTGNANTATRLLAYTHNSGGYSLVSATRTDGTLSRDIYDNGRALIYRAEGQGVNAEIATIDSNVASATKLATPRTIWGQSFDGTSDITGILISDIWRIIKDYSHNGTFIQSKNYAGTSYLGNIFITGWNGNDLSSFNVWAITSTFNGNVAIGGTTADEKLHVHGNGKFSGALLSQALRSAGISIGCDASGVASDNFAREINTFANKLYLQYRGGDLDLCGGGGTTYIGGALDGKTANFTSLTSPAITTNSLTIGGVTLTYDSGNEALCINGNMYALRGVTAGGAGISTYSSLEARVARLEQQLNIS